jgi:hypothetical protein
MTALVDIPKGLQQLKVEILLFDKQNYRLPPESDAWNQTKLCLALEEYELLPIGESMADNGYFLEEPLIGIPSGDGRVIIIEGNRRLATLKFLSEPDLRKLSKNKEEWEQLAEKASTNKQDLMTVPVVIHSAREELDAILGFRHITSTLKWDPLCKARFIHDLMIRKKTTDLNELAKEIGARQDTIKSNFIAFNLYNEAKELEIDTSKVESKFGVFYTALNNSEIREYIGLDVDKPIEELKKPVPIAKKVELKNFIELLHGNSSGVDPVIDDSRKISELGDVLAVDEARKVLLETRNMRIAKKLTGGEEKSLLENLDSARVNLMEANKNVFLYFNNPKVKSAVELCKKYMDQIIHSCEEAEKEAEAKKQANKA